MAGAVPQTPHCRSRPLHPDPHERGIDLVPCPPTLEVRPATGPLLRLGPPVPPGGPGLAVPSCASEGRNGPSPRPGSQRRRPTQAGRRTGHMGGTTGAARRASRPTSLNGHLDGTRRRGSLAPPAVPRLSTHDPRRVFPERLNRARGVILHPPLPRRVDAVDCGSYAPAACAPTQAPDDSEAGQEANTASVGRAWLSRSGEARSFWCPTEKAGTKHTAETGLSTPPSPRDRPTAHIAATRRSRLATEPPPDSGHATRL
jgi:hypothetical protein